VRVFVGDQREVITKCSTFVFGGVVVVAATTNLWARAVLFLREQVRGLRVQEFLRELVVGVAVPGDLTGLIIVEILHSVEGRDIEQVCSNLEIILPCLRLLISLALVFIYRACLYCLSLYMLDILVFN